MEILTVHGWAFCSSVFSKIEGAKHFEVDHSLDLKKNADLLAELITSDTLLVGWSLGATLSVMASVKRAPKGLILIGATPHFGRAWKSGYLERFFKELEENYERKIEEFRKTAYGRKVDCPIPPKEGATRLLKEFVKTDLTRTFKGSEIKTLLLHGRKDPITPFRELRKLLKLNPRFEGLVYDGGHFPTQFSQRDWEEVFARLR